MINRLILLTCFCVLVSCASNAPPSTTTDVCKIFKERYSWYKAAKKTEKRWKIPIPVSMAIIKQESSFIADARPQRTKLLGFIPWKRVTSARGFAQAVDGTWQMYLDDRGGWFVQRNDFEDAVDFIGWYNYKTHKQLGIPMNNARALYLAYHEGWGNYKHYKKNKKIINLAKRVEKQSNVYKKQLKECSSSLSRNKYIIF